MAKKQKRTVVDEDELLADPSDRAPLAGKRKNGKKVTEEPVDAATLSQYDPDGDLVDIWERRMLNPDLRQAKPIRVKTPGMHLRWINLSSAGRYQRARYDEGWVPVLKAELVDEREIYGVSYTNEGWVCRGEKQSEMLMKIPEAVWKKIRSRRHHLIQKSNENIKSKLMSSGARYFGDKYNQNKGDEIASTLGNFEGEIKFGTEKIEPDADILGEE